MEFEDKQLFEEIQIDERLTWDRAGEKMHWELAHTYADLIHAKIVCAYQNTPVANLCHISEAGNFRGDNSAAESDDFGINFRWGSRHIFLQTSSCPHSPTQLLSPVP
jgi:hypothetical protein